MAPLSAPQMVVNSRMLYTSWMPADPEAAAALLPPGGPRPAGPVYMNQYVVDSDEQTSGFGAYSLTYLGLDIAGMMDPQGMIPARYMLFYFNSSELMREYTVREYDLPATPGATSLEAGDGRVVATTSLDGTPVIRTEAAIGSDILMVATGQLTYVRQMAGRFMAGNFPFIADLVQRLRGALDRVPRPEPPRLRPAAGGPAPGGGGGVVLLAEGLLRVPRRGLRGQLLTVAAAGCPYGAGGADVPRMVSEVGMRPGSGASPCCIRVASIAPASSPIGR